MVRISCAIMNLKSSLCRRDFIAGTAAFAASSVLARTADGIAAAPPPAIRTIVFQGDSITDAGRDRTGHANEPACMGPGYVGLIAAQLLQKNPEMQIFNRGMSGHRVLDLLCRWEGDTLALQPDLVSILIGVNDTWHQHLPGGHGSKVPRYTALYRMLLDDTLARRPTCRLLLCEPFALPVEGASFKADWMPELRERMAVVRALAKEYGAILVPFQEKFEEAAKQHRAGELASDGVHPTLLGFQLMARVWREAAGL